LFKKPSLNLARSRSFQTTATVNSSANTSFNTISSSQQSQADTAVTSFTSDAYDADVSYPKLTRTSFTTMASLEDEDLANASAQLQRETEEHELRQAQGSQELAQEASQEMTRESTSTFESIDEHGLLKRSFHVKAEYEVPAIPQPTSPIVEGTPHTIELRRSPRTTYMSSTTPARLGQKTFQFIDAGNSPSKLPYYIRDIPYKNLFVERPSDQLLQQFPYFILFICCRVANETGVPMNILLRDMFAGAYSSPGVFWEIMQDNAKSANTIFQFKESAQVWSAAKRNFEGYTFKGRLVFGKKKEVFGLRLLPIEPDKSCRLQRKFGSHRFLYLNLSPFESGSKTKPSRFNREEMKQIQESWKSWFHNEHSFLGRKWRAFHIEPIKRKGGRPKEDDSDRRLIMFAIEGVGIEPVSLGTMLNWFFPFARNMDQSFCKAYARLDLGLSRTIPTLMFKPSQLRRVPDTLANGTPEETRFNDPTLDWDEKPSPNAVMNDGCARISVGAALAIWKIYCVATDTRNEPMPSVFQGRIGGAKGLWMACGEPSTTDPEELDIWIEITPSQLKFKPHEEDLFDDTFDPLRLTFEHINHSSKPSQSELHISFIPILVDRGVPQEVIAGLIKDRLDAERERLLQMLPNPVKLYHWLYRQSPSIADESPRWQAALPHSLPNKITLLLQSGFLPEAEPYLASVVLRYIRQNQLWMEQKLKTPLGRATFLYGIADPLGVLEPGEVHVDFSSPFVDEINGSTFRALSNMDLLVARQPACRYSDIQKVRAVKHPDLSHLVDVVVFPSKGQYPLAGKLQGGDYDGDIFYLCWEPDLVRPFKNAPAPLATIGHEQYGIEKDSRKLYEVMRYQDLSTVDIFLREVLDFRMAPSLLGKVTNFLEKKAYQENQVYSRKLNALCDLHDLLVDAPKSGFRLSDPKYNNLIQKQLRCGNPKDPAYKVAMKDCASTKELGDADKLPNMNYQHKKDNIIDYLYFEVVRKHDVATLMSVKKAFCKDKSDDSDLQRPYEDLRNNGSETVKAVLATLLNCLKEIHQTWNEKLRSKMELNSEAYNETVDHCYQQFRELMPSNAIHPDIRALLNPYLHRKFSIWVAVRASALYTMLPTKPAFVWHMAGRDLARMKAESQPNLARVIPSIFANLKPKPAKAPKPEEAEEESEEDCESTVERTTT
jgi:hypothetical protein